MSRRSPNPRMASVPAHRDEAEFLQRLVRYPALRARYLQDPVGTARAEGLPELARELADADSGLEALEQRESKSSFAGVLTRLAVEGVGFFDAVHGHLGAVVASAAVPRHHHSAAPAVLEMDDDAGDEEDDDPGEDVDEDGEDSPDDDDDDSESDDSDDADSSSDDEDDEDDDDESDESDDDADGGDDDEEDDDSDDGGDEADAGDRGAALERRGRADLDGAPTAYPGDGAPREQIAAWMARAAKARGLPPELPVMASLVESNLQNLSYGHADSVGFFQMRASIWDQGEYAGYAQRPELQLEWFLDHAEAMGKQRVARGLPVDDPDHYGEWIADVERPAAQYRGRYQLQFDEAREVLAAFEAPDAAPAAGKRATAALGFARSMMGVPYKWGGETPEEGFDCSGLVQWAYAKAGISLPRVTDQQFVAPGGIAVKRGDLQPGDLVFFRDSTGYVHHVGISLGGDRFIGAPHTGANVRIDSLDDAYWSKEFAGGRRFDQLLKSGRGEARVLPVVTRSR